MMQYMLLFSRHGKLRLQKWFVTYSEQEKKRFIRELIAKVLIRKTKMSAFLDYHGLRIVYKRLIAVFSAMREKCFVFSYASLYFLCAIEENDNELYCLELIHRFVELLDRYFGCVRSLVFVTRSCCQYTGNRIGHYFQLRKGLLHS